MKTKAQKKKNLVKKKTEKRNSVRFSADLGALALILTDDEGHKLNISLPALVVDESFKGCSLIAVKNPLIKRGHILQVKVGHLAPMYAEIRWIKVFDAKICYFGLSYIE